MFDIDPSSLKALEFQGICGMARFLAPAIVVVGAPAIAALSET
jgi:hypothetical protein